MTDRRTAVVDGCSYLLVQRHTGVTIVLKALKDICRTRFRNSGANAVFVVLAQQINPRSPVH